MNETQDADIIDRAKTELRDLLAIVAPHLTPMDTLSGLISQINNVLAWMRDQIPKTTNEGRALPDAPKDGPWAWAIVDPNERLRSQDGEPVETLITWCGVAADSFLSDAIEAMNEGDAEPYIVPLYPREQPAPPAELAALRAECDKAWAEIDALRQRLTNATEIAGHLKLSNIREAACWIVPPPLFTGNHLPPQNEIDVRIDARNREVERVEKIVKLMLLEHFGELKQQLTAAVTRAERAEGAAQLLYDAMNKCERSVGNIPGHCHLKRETWDGTNRPCLECQMWNHAMKTFAALAAARDAKGEA
jgi:hypothetical protein